MMKRENILLLGLVVLLAAFPLVMSSGDFGGSDDKAKEMINEVNRDYQPWFSAFWEPSSEVESFLFALQAAMGAGFIGYFFGRQQSKKLATKTAE
jgi:cobalt/nickel transport protein